MPRAERDALAQAQSGDTVRFVPELSGGTITMSEMSLTIPYFAVRVPEQLRYHSREAEEGYFDVR